MLRLSYPCLGSGDAAQTGCGSTFALTVQAEAKLVPTSSLRFRDLDVNAGVFSLEVNGVSWHTWPNARNWLWLHQSLCLEQDGCAGQVAGEVVEVCAVERHSGMLCKEATGQVGSIAKNICRSAAKTWAPQVAQKWTILPHG